MFAPRLPASGETAGESLGRKTTNARYLRATTKQARKRPLLFLPGSLLITA